MGDDETVVIFSQLDNLNRPGFNKNTSNKQAHSKYLLPIQRNDRVCICVGVYMCGCACVCLFVCVSLFLPSFFSQVQVFLGSYLLL